MLKVPINGLWIEPRRPQLTLRDPSPQTSHRNSQIKNQHPVRWQHGLRQYPANTRGQQRATAMIMIPRGLLQNRKSRINRHHARIRAWRR